MKHIAEYMRRDPNPDEIAVLDDVLEVARAWERGELPLAGVKTACSGYERWQAMRFAVLGSTDKRTLMALSEALVASDPTGFDTPHGWMGMGEVFAAQAKATTNHEGKRVYLWPMHWTNGEAQFPLAHLPPGEERRTREEAATAAYHAYRKAKAGSPRTAKGWER